MNKRIAIIFIYLIFLSACNKKSITLPEITNNETISNLIIDIKGEVYFPGIYVLPNNSILNDAIRLAGGLTPRANISDINLATQLVNNQMIVIPSIVENIKSNDSSSNDSSSNDSSFGSLNSKISLNKADLATLMTIPNIGKVKAQNIIDYRNKNGPFKVIEDIKKVSGIGEETYNKIKDYLFIS